MFVLCGYVCYFFFSSRRRHTRCALVTGVQTCALPISLAARKTLALLIAKAAGEAWRPGSHVIAKRELRGTHNANDRIQDTLDELMDVKFQMPSTSAKGAPRPSLPPCSPGRSTNMRRMAELPSSGRSRPRLGRTEERRVGKEGVSTWRSRGSRKH